MKIKVNRYKGRFNHYQSHVTHGREIIKIVMQVSYACSSCCVLMFVCNKFKTKWHVINRNVLAIKRNGTFLLEKWKIQAHVVFFSSLKKSLYSKLELEYDNRKIVSLFLIGAHLGGDNSTPGHSDISKMVKNILDHLVCMYLAM